METLVLGSEEHLDGRAFGALGNHQANVVSGLHGLPSPCGGRSEPWPMSPREESVRVMRLWNWAAGPAGQSSARAGGLSPCIYRRPFSVSQHMFFSSRTCLSLRHLFVTSADM